MTVQFLVKQKLSDLKYLIKILAYLIHSLLKNDFVYMIFFISTNNCTFTRQRNKERFQLSWLWKKYLRFKINGNLKDFFSFFKYGLISKLIK